MREDLEWEAREEEGLQQLYDELGPQWARDHAPEIFAENYDDAVRQFTAERLVSYYVDHRDLALPAHDALQYAKSLQIEHPRAALVFAATSIEVTIKDVLLRPIVYGLVHNHALAEYVANLSVAQRSSAATFAELLRGVFHNLVRVDFPSYKEMALHLRY